MMPKEDAHCIPCLLCQLVLIRDYEEFHPCRSFETPGTAFPIDLLHNQQTPGLWGSSGEDTCELPTHSDGAESTAEPQDEEEKLTRLPAATEATVSHPRLAV